MYLFKAVCATTPYKEIFVKLASQMSICLPNIKDLKEKIIVCMI
jgi:hypothetical protein